MTEERKIKAVFKTDDCRGGYCFIEKSPNGRYYVNYGYEPATEQDGRDIVTDGRWKLSPYAPSMAAGYGSYGAAAAAVKKQRPSAQRIRTPAQLSRHGVENADYAQRVSQILTREYGNSRYAKNKDSYKGAGYSAIVFAFGEWSAGRESRTRLSDARLEALCGYGERRHGLLKELYKQMEKQTRSTETEGTRDTTALVRDAAEEFCERKFGIKRSVRSREGQTKSLAAEYFGRDGDGTAYYRMHGYLSRDSLSEITERAERYVIAADALALSGETLERNKIAFLKTGRDILPQQLAEDAETVISELHAAAQGRQTDGAMRTAAEKLREEILSSKHAEEYMLLTGADAGDISPTQRDRKLAALAAKFTDEPEAIARMMRESGANRPDRTDAYYLFTARQAIERQRTKGVVYLGSNTFTDNSCGADPSENGR